ncbi:hypothetical protein EYF80_050116 [Liparis tanakae]|uniref:Uncharacterized protein n=1 Tax=Liparis tanakae TaxID=230148 RepID=A0A4Z2FFN7_9TELE|nr:hypothetical protein EYF80_050116 [Liparis tanakae]
MPMQLSSCRDLLRKSAQASTTRRNYKRPGRGQGREEVTHLIKLNRVYSRSECIVPLSKPFISTRASRLSFRPLQNMALHRKHTFKDTSSGFTAAADPLGCTPPEVLTGSSEYGSMAREVVSLNTQNYIG